MRANSDTGTLVARRFLATTFGGLGCAMAGFTMMGISTFWSRTDVIDGMAITRGVLGAGCSDNEGVFGGATDASARATCCLGLKRASAASRALFTCARSLSGQSVAKGFLRGSNRKDWVAEGFQMGRARFCRNGIGAEIQCFAISNR